MIIAKEDIWEISIMVHPKRCLKKNCKEKKKGGLTVSLFFLVGVTRLERTTIPTQVGMRWPTE